MDPGIAPSEPRARRFPRKRWLLLGLAVVVLGGAAAVHWLGHVDVIGLARDLKGHPWARTLYLLLSVAASLLFVPRTLMAAAGGFVFGFWEGLLWTSLGSTAGAILAFLLARYVSAGLVDATTLPRLGPVLAAADRSGWRAVTVMRLLPLPHTPVNYALGVTRMRLDHYAVGSLLGMLPSSIVCVQLGAAGNQILAGVNWLYPTVGALLLVGVSFVLPRLPAVRRSLKP